ncbi:MAG: single-stranded-DNA-specific exonuclease RecJ [Eubacterium sp.]|nr:single-stranded-DNA-specific exonuclease RecJ [Eubacterium sp.]
MAYKKWVIRDADKEKASLLSEKFNIDPFIAFLLVSRGIDDDVAVSDFLNDTTEFTSPFNFADMEEASFTIGDAIDNGDKICVYGDYDCDGVTSTALLVSFLKKEGADVFYYIPDREGEGYGLNKSAIDKIKEDGAELIVTVDNGINSVDEAEYIYSLGMRLVITDHHRLGDTLPRAEAVINPYREENSLEFRDYCGVGVAFKLICAIFEDDIEELMGDYLDLVAVGTIADMVPLRGENRFFVKAGLEILNNRPRPAFRNYEALNKDDMTSNSVAFQICPRINALGRMGDASRAVELLLSDSPDKSIELREKMEYANSLRQETEKQILDDVKSKIAENPSLAEGRVIVIAGSNYHQGVVGIVASHLVGEYAKPVFVIGIDDEGIARGSARSIEGFNIFDAISACSNDLIRFGGHPLAAGVTLNADNIDLFRKHINEYALEKYDIMPSPKLVLDCKISPDYLNFELVDSLSVLEPYGESNPQAVFGVYKMKLIDVQPLKENRHLRLVFEKNGCVIKAVKFGMSSDTIPYKAGDILNLALRVGKNSFNGRNYLSLQIVDMKLASNDDEKYFAEKNAYDKYKLTDKADKSFYPDREVCALLYRFLKSNYGYRLGIDNLYFRLQNKLSYAQLRIALKAFEQAGLIEVTDIITMNKVDQKVSLENTEVLKALRERLSLDS